MREKKRLTAAEFAAVKPLLKISDDRIEAARQALVEGRTLQAIGDQFGWSRQAVGDAVAVVWRMSENYRRSQLTASVLLPAGWEQVTVIAPSELIQKLRSEIGGLPPAGNDKRKPGVRRRRASKST
jgi:hypothetical protein